MSLPALLMGTPMATKGSTKGPIDKEMICTNGTVHHGFSQSDCGSWLIACCIGPLGQCHVTLAQIRRKSIDGRPRNDPNNPLEQRKSQGRGGKPWPDQVEERQQHLNRDLVIGCSRHIGEATNPGPMSSSIWVSHGTGPVRFLVLSLQFGRNSPKILHAKIMFWFFMLFLCSG